MFSSIKKLIFLCALFSASISYAQFCFKGEAPEPCPRPCLLPDGIYIGSQIGYNNYSFRESYNFSFDGGATFLSGSPFVSAKGWLGGFFVGFGRHLTPIIYLGLELYDNFSGAKSSFVNTSEDNRYHGKVRGDNMAGISLLPGLNINPTTRAYGRFGYVSGHFKTRQGFENFTLPNSGVDSSSGSHTGWQAGLGLQSLFTENWSTRFEYNYIRFRSFGIGNFPFTINQHKLKGSDNQFSVAVVYHYC